MSILIDTVRVSCFRGIRDLEIPLSRVTVLVGANNSGKTSLLKALHLALGDYSRFLSEEDYYISPDDKRATEIVVDVRIRAVDNEGNPDKGFSEEWVTEFGDKIRAKPDGEQYLALRTRSRPNAIKGGFETTRYSMEKWPDKENWLTEKLKETKLNTRMESLPYIPIEAQRDIHQELKEKSSFVGKVLSSVEYNASDIATLEKLIREVNESAVNKSGELQSLKTHLENLNSSFQGGGNAEITPFPKKIRDLSKHFTVHFGEGDGGTFSMEYHGMGTRSWASMLTVKAFTEMMSVNHKKEDKPFFPVIAAEEPEAHLHPHAQKTLYNQLVDVVGQIIVSTHSPYLAALAQQSELLYLKRTDEGVKEYRLGAGLDAEDSRRLRREVIHSRGEIIFSKAIVLCEGETEEQALPLLFDKYFECESFAKGVSFVGVGGSGKKYLPFFIFARDFSIPLFVFSDGEEKTVKDLKKHYESVYGETDVDNCPYITILDDTDFEGYLISNGFKEHVEKAIRDLEGENAIENWVKKMHGTKKRRMKADMPPCETCDQPIYTDVIRDYKDADGYERALGDILDSGKTKYAPAIGEELCKLNSDDFPLKIVELLKKIENGAEL